MANRLLINIANVVEWLKSGEETNGFYANVVNFLEKAIDILQLAIDDLRGKDIHHTNKVHAEVTRMPFRRCHPRVIYKIRVFFTIVILAHVIVCTR